MMNLTQSELPGGEPDLAPCGPGLSTVRPAVLPLGIWPGRNKNTIIPRGREKAEESLLLVYRVLGREDRLPPLPALHNPLSQSKPALWRLVEEVLVECVQACPAES